MVDSVLLSSPYRQEKACKNPHLQAFFFFFSICLDVFDSVAQLTKDVILFIAYITTGIQNLLEG